MAIPRLAARQHAAAHFEPAEQLAYFRTAGWIPPALAPSGVIFCYQRSLLRQVIAAEQPERVACVTGKLYPLPSTGGRVVLAAEFGIGAPAAAMLMELLIAMGARQFISIGTAGAIDPGLQIGDLVLCGEAVRDEGVSAHYLAHPDDPALPDPALSAAFGAALNRGPTPPVAGPSWTIDAIFRETPAQIAHYQAHGVLAVEMEAAALFAVAAMRGVQIAAGFVISDLLSTATWQPQFDHPDVSAGLGRLFEAARTTLG